MVKPPRIRSSKTNTAFYRFLDWLIAVGLGVLAVVLLLFVFMTPIIANESSINDIYRGELVFADRIGKYFANYERGDIVVYKLGRTGKPHFGRIIAFSGEVVQLSDGKVYIDNSYLNETEYAAGFKPDDSFVFTVPKGKFFVLPDDRSGMDGQRVDAMTFSASEIIGEVRFRIYPFNKLELFD